MIPYPDEKLDDGFHDGGAFPVDPDKRGDVTHVEMVLVVDELVEDTAGRRKKNQDTSTE